MFEGYSRNKVMESFSSNINFLLQRPRFAGDTNQNIFKGRKELPPLEEEWEGMFQGFFLTDECFHNSHLILIEKSWLAGDIIRGHDITLGIGNSRNISPENSGQP